MQTRRVLLIAYHYPPIQGSSGVQRTLRFAQYLPEFGWSPIVLTIDPRAYENQSTSGHRNPVPEENVHRAFGLDAARHFSFLGRYPRRLALPDRWASWRYFAVRKALGLLATQPVDIIFSTFPVATAHAIGLDVAQRTGLPWVAEFRDPMWQGDYPPDPRVNSYWRELESRVVSRANTTVVVTPGAAKDYATRYPMLERDGRLQIIENGFDEAEFAAAERRLRTTPGNKDGRSGPFVLLHSGVIYPSERDPTQLFGALALLKGRGLINARNIRVILRAAGDSAAYRLKIKELEIEDLVEFPAGIDYSSALEEMLQVDALLLLQASNCNAQIPAKAYEYIRAGRPILALTDPAGDTARLVLSTRSGIVARLDSESDIATAIETLIQDARSGGLPAGTTDVARSFARRNQTHELAQILDKLADRQRASRWPLPK